MTASVTDLERPPEVAVMVVDPKAVAVATPLEPDALLMVATPVFADPQVTEAVMSWVELSEKVPVAVNWRVEPTSMVGEAGVTAMDTSDFTVSVAVPETPRVAVMTVEPPERDEAVPPALIAAIPVLDDSHVTSWVTSRVVLFDSVPVAANCCVAPTTMAGFAGVTAMDVTVAVVSLVEPEIPAKDALMMLSPAAAPAVAFPSAPIVAICAFDELQTVCPVRSWVASFNKRPEALNCWVVPTMPVESAGVTAIDTSGDDVTVVEAETVPETAVIVAEPAATAVAAPFDPSELPMDTMPASDELHATDAVKSWMEPFEKKPVALNWTFDPVAILVPEGETVTAVRVTGADVLPSHPASIKTDISTTKQKCSVL